MLHKASRAHFTVALGCRPWLAISMNGRATCCETSPHRKERLKRTEATQSESILVWQLTHSPLSRGVGPAGPCLERVNGGSRLGAVPVSPSLQASPRGLKTAVEACPAAALASSCMGSLSMLSLCSVHTPDSTPAGRLPSLLFGFSLLGRWPASGLSEWLGLALPAFDSRPAMEERKAWPCSCLRGDAVLSAGSPASSEATCTTAAALSAAPPGPTLHLGGAELVKQPLAQLPLQLCNCALQRSLRLTSRVSGWPGISLCLL